jgi:hypothetical protein
VPQYKSWLLLLAEETTCFIVLMRMYDNTCKVRVIKVHINWSLSSVICRISLNNGYVSDMAYSGPSD